MARYMIDGVAVETNKAKGHWDENSRWDGRNWISKATGSQWEHETLYLSSKDRYYVVHQSNWQGTAPSAEFVDAADAAAWLLRNGYKLENMPEDLRAIAEEKVE